MLQPGVPSVAQESFMALEKHLFGPENISGPERAADTDVLLLKMFWKNVTYKTKSD